MTSRYVDQAARVGKMTAALRRHLAGDAFEYGRKRQAAYIIEDIDPEDCIALDEEAFRIEGVRRHRNQSVFGVDPALL